MLFKVMQNIPKKHQTLLFSATMPVEIEELAQVRFYLMIISIIFETLLVYIL